jgi:hypothetical protein
VHLFTTQHGALHPRSLQRRLVHYREQCGVPVTAQRLRHTFASQMLTAGMPVSSLQRYLGHEHLDTTMIYAEVSDPLLRQDYYQGIAALDSGSEKKILADWHHLNNTHSGNWSKNSKHLGWSNLAMMRFWISSWRI